MKAHGKVWGGTLFESRSLGAEGICFEVGGWVVLANEGAESLTPSATTHSQSVSRVDN
jgi:hypothetical protein